MFGKQRGVHYGVYHIKPLYLSATCTQTSLITEVSEAGRKLVVWKAITWAQPRSSLIRRCAQCGIQQVDCLNLY